ncbi:acyltransferase [bacterium]|nr:acyltransferase [bacterium]
MPQRNDPSELMALDRRVASLDGIRGIAVLLVLVHHASHHLLPFGWIGVDYFFVLSGFLITRLLIRRRESPIYFRDFYWRRALRILPIYLMCITVPYFAGVSSWEEFRYQLMSLQNFYYARGPQNPLAIHTWSLAVEEQFYVFWSVLIFITAAAWRPRICLILIFMSPILRAIQPPEGSFASLQMLLPYRMDSFAYGGLLASLPTSFYGKAWFRIFSRYILLFGAACLFAAMLYDYAGVQPYAVTPLANHLSLGLLYTIVAWVPFGMLGTLLTDNPERPGVLARSLNWRPLVFVGRISYGLYLYHFFVSRSLDFLWPTLYDLPWLRAIVLAAISIPVATISWKLIEEPLLGYRSVIAQRHHVKQPGGGV